MALQGPDGSVPVWEVPLEGWGLGVALGSMSDLGAPGEQAELGRPGATQRSGLRRVGTWGNGCGFDRMPGQRKLLGYSGGGALSSAHGQEGQMMGGDGQRHGQAPAGGDHQSTEEAGEAGRLAQARGLQ